MKYRNQILKIIALNEVSYANIQKEEFIKVILINHGQFVYALLIDEFYEFIISNYKLESMFSAEGINKGSIIHNNEIIYVVNEIKLDEFANKKMEIAPAEIVNDKSNNYFNNITKAA